MQNVSFAPVILFYFEVTFEGCLIHRETVLPSQHQFKKLVKAILQDRVVRLVYKLAKLMREYIYLRFL